MTTPTWVDAEPGEAQALTDAERQELEALRKASRRQHMVTDFRNATSTLAPMTSTLFHAWMNEQGFWESKNFGEKIALIHSELSEALEADRKSLMSDHLEGIPGVAEELADALIRIIDLAAHLQLDLGQLLHAKMQYNYLRPFKHDKAY